MIEEERDIKHSDPPRLNRCEKQCIAYNDVLQDLGKENYVDSNQLGHQVIKTSNFDRNLLIISFTRYSVNVSDILKSNGEKIENLILLRLGNFESEKSLLSIMGD